MDPREQFIWIKWVLNTFRMCWISDRYQPWLMGLFKFQTNVIYSHDSLYRTFDVRKEVVKKIKRFKDLKSNES